MKLKNLIIISLILTFLTIGAVSATDDALSVCDNFDNSTNELNIINQEMEDDIQTQNEESDIAISDDISYEIDDEAYLDEDDEIVEFRSYDTSQTGTLNVYVDYDLKYTTKITSSSYHYDDDDEEYAYELYLTASDLDMTDYKTYYVQLTFNDETLAQSNVKINYPLYLSVYDALDYSNDLCTIDGTIKAHMTLPEDATNQLTLTINGKSYNIDYKDGEATLKLNTLGWGVGEYTARLSYAGDSKYPYDYTESTFKIIPKFTYPHVIAKNEKEYLTITSNRESNGNVKLYSYTDYYGSDETFIADIAIKNGYGSYSLSNLASGDHIIKAECLINGVEFEYYYMDITIKNNSPLFTSSISASSINQRDSVTVKVKGPKVNSLVGIYLDDKEIKSISLINGEIIHVISGLSAGSHKVNVFYDVNDQFYSNTFYINVKNVQSNTKTAKYNPKIQLTLKTGNVKKSAKKTVLTVTLKVNGKAQKGIKITIKFNGKKYAVKTNKKGVAKVTIKKNVLKKLKVGKKVKCQAIYGKITVKKSVKVKK